MTEEINSQPIETEQHGQEIIRLYKKLTSSDGYRHFLSVHFDKEEQTFDHFGYWKQKPIESNCNKFVAVQGKELRKIVLAFKKDCLTFLKNKNLL